MSSHYDEEAQAEELRRWWKENRVPLLAGVVLGLAVIFGWQTWTGHRDAHRAAGSEVYDELGRALAAQHYDEAAKIGDRLERTFDNTPYAEIGDLKLARAAVDAGRFDEAQRRLQWAVDHGDDPALKPLVILRLARVVWAQGKPADALALLDHDGGAYEGLYAELRGDLKLAGGDRAGALTQYQAALKHADAQEAESARAGLQRKIDDLADVATTVRS